MAIKPIDVRLDELNQEQADMNQRVDLSATLPESKVQPVDIQAMTPDMAQGEQVAGLIGGLRDITKSVVEGIKTTPIKQAPKLSPEAKAAADLAETKKAAEVMGVADQQRAGIAATIEQAKKPEMTPEALLAEKDKVAAERAGIDAATEIPPKTEFNQPRMETTEDIKNWVEAINNKAGIETKHIKLDDPRLLAAANDAGIGVDFIDKLVKNKLPVDPENTLKALNAMAASAKRLEEIAQKVVTSQASPELVAEMAQTIHFHSVLQTSVKGYQTNIAQSLAVMRIPRTGAADISAILEDFGSNSDITRFAQAYLELNDPIARAKMIAEKTTTTTWDKLFTVYVNGLLSRPTTHIKNALSNTVFMPWRLTERALASGIGALRRSVGLGSEDVYRMSEVSSIIGATPQAFINGFELAAKAAKTGIPSSWTDPIKIARQSSRMDLFSVPSGDSFASAAIRGLNFVTTVPGRALMTADEFFKGINYTHELAAEATRMGATEFDTAIKAGKSVADAQQISDDAITKFLAAPPDYIAGLAEVGTFTQKLEGKIGSAMQSINPSSPAGFVFRTQMPFIGTPVNIMAETIARTPLGIFSKDIRSALTSGMTKESDMALAKVGLGSSALYTFSDFANNGSLTGSGPGEKGTRDAMIRQGWQPYSFVLKMSNIDDDMKMALSKLPTAVTYGSGDYSGNVYISYQGMEPIGAMMAMASDYIDYAKYEGDDSRINAAFGGIAFGFGNYMLQSPFLQGVQNIQQIVGGYQANDKSRFVEAVNKISMIFAEVGRKSVTPLSGAVTSVKEKFDPLQRDYQADPNLPAGIKGMMDAFNKMKSETPGWSSSLPPKLNIWGEPVSHEFAYMPWRMKEGKMRDSDQMLIQLNANVQMPDRSMSAKDPNTGITANIKLTTDEYNEMLRIANQDLKLEDNVMSVVNFIEKDAGRSDLVTYQTAIKKPFEDTFAAAKKMLISQSIYSDAIQERLAKQAKQIKDFGKGAR